MKILIEKNVKTYSTGKVVEYYRVKYNRGFWWPFWQYVQQHYTNANSEVKDFETLEEAIRVARKLRDEYDGPDHKITDLDIYGVPVHKYCGG